MYLDYQILMYQYSNVKHINISMYKVKYCLLYVNINLILLL